MTEITMTHASAAAQTTPFTAYDLEYFWGGENDEVLLRVETHPATITRYGVVSGCTAPTVGVKYRDGRKAQASVDMFYATQEDAEAEAVRAIAEARTNPPYGVLRQKLAHAVRVLQQLSGDPHSPGHNYQARAFAALRAIDNITGA